MRKFIVRDNRRKTIDTFETEGQALRYAQDLLEDLGSYDIEIIEVLEHWKNP